LFAEHLPHTVAGHGRLCVGKITCTFFPIDLIKKND
jgi:hypothetical protein